MADSSTAANPFDGNAAQLLPQNVEKLPLWHWRPGARLLCVGSRDGARFDGELDPAEERTFQRRVSAELLDATQRRAHTDGVAACWSASLRYPRGLRLLAEHCRGALVLVTAGFGDEGLLAELLPRVDAWLLLHAGGGGPLDERILGEGRHVEVLWGLRGDDELPALAWERAAAVHLCAERSTSAVGERLAAWEARARAHLPAACRCYGGEDRHTLCRGCGAVLVWRAGGRSRAEHWDAESGRCRNCGARADLSV